MKVFFVLLCVYVVQGVEFQFLNKLSGPIWVGSQGGKNFPPLNGGGWVLNPGNQITVNAQDDWSGRFWARTGCDPQSQHCETGDCGNKLQCNGAGGVPPVTLVEITMKGDEGKDFYDVSLVDGYNVEASIKPLGGQQDGSRNSCRKSSCLQNVLPVCPGEFQVKNGQGAVISCKSACLQLNTDEYCCRNAHNTKETCKSTDWPENYAKIFKDKCPDAYSYAYDDDTGTFTCKASQYLIVFGA